MEFDTSDPTYQDLLARVVQQGSRVVPFVGAGLSAYGDVSQRLPMWRELLDRLEAEGRSLGLIPNDGDPVIDAALSSGRYIEAMDRLIAALGEPTFRRAVERELDDRGRPVPPAVTELVAVSWSLIVTTNLDRLVARAYFERYGRPLQTVTNLDTHRLAAALSGTLSSNDTLLAQIHGDIDTYPSWRLTRSHYEQLLRDPGYMEALKHLFLRQVFFVGFGLQDDDFDLLLETVARIYPAGVGEFFALIAQSRRDDERVVELIRTNGLRPIFYDVDPEPDPEDPYAGHIQVHQCLRHLAHSWARARTSLPVTLKYFPELDPFLVGRDEDLEQLAGLVTGGSSGVVQVIGLGGSGKTSLVQKFVQEHAYEISAAGYSRVFGCSFYRADIGQFIQDLQLALGGPISEPLAAQVERVAEHLGRYQTLLVLDGVEAVIDGEHEWRSPYVAQIVDAALLGGGTVVLTSRVPVRGSVFEQASIVDIADLDLDAVRQFLAGWGLSQLDEALIRRFADATAGHPIALRILAGVLREVPVQEIAATIERSAAVDVDDEVDPLRENRLARILGSYVRHLNVDHVALLTCFTAFAGPTPFPLVDAALTRMYPGGAANNALVGADLRPVVADLLDRRLLIASTGGELTDHPTVRDYFARRADAAGVSLRPIHRFLADLSLEQALEVPETFNEAIPLIDAARHVAACEDWSLFDEIFMRRLMRGFRNHLCNNLGAWEEALGLARLAIESSYPAQQTSAPAYYPVTEARCLKHLGRSDEGRLRYLSGLRLAAEARDPDTAKYVNNLFTMLVWRGELTAADHLVELNVRALSWIEEPWQRRWQVEHGFSTFAYLRLLQGDLAAAEDLFSFSRHAWDDHPGERLWIYDHYPLHRSELLLLGSPEAHAASLEVIDEVIAVATANQWPESICRGYVQEALVLLDRAGKTGDRADVALARQRLDAARSLNAGMVVPDVEIAHLLAGVKASVVLAEIGASRTSDHDNSDAALDRAAVLVERSGLGLASPDLAAARGALELRRGRTDTALALHDQALRLCRAAGNELAPRSGRSFVGWLGQQLDIPYPPAPHARRPDVRSWIGSDLTTEEMLRHLDALPSADA